MDRPPVVFQNHLSKAVTVSGRSRRVVCGTVTFNSNDVATRPLGVNDGQIDKKARLADLLFHEVTVLGQGSRNLLLEDAIEVPVGHSAHVQVARARVPEEPLKCSDPLSMCPVKVNVFVRYRAEYLAATFCAGNQYIQPPLATVGAQGREAHEHAPLLVPPIPNRDEHEISLVALHILQVLYEEWLVGMRDFEKTLRILRLAPQNLQFIHNRVPLRSREGNDTER
jgi:hypothetical protein